MDCHETLTVHCQKELSPSSVHPLREENDSVSWLPDGKMRSRAVVSTPLEANPHSSRNSTTVNVGAMYFFLEFIISCCIEVW